METMPFQNSATTMEQPSRPPGDADAFRVVPPLLDAGPAAASPGSAAELRDFLGTRAPLKKKTPKSPPAPISAKTIGIRP